MDSNIFGSGSAPAPSLQDQAPVGSWPGNTKLLYGGRLVFGPDCRNLLPTLFMILAPIVVFYVFVGSHLVNEFHHHGGVAILVMVGVHTCAVLVLLMLTSARDPGIIPRSNRPPTLEEAGITSLENIDQRIQYVLPATKEVLKDGVTVTVKYCRTCMFYRPPRCSHCSICDNCVDCFDHHCPWLGQCIGRRNYIFFFMFVLSSTFLCFFIFSMCALRIKKLMDGDAPHTVLKALQRSPASVVLMAYAFLSAWFVGGLTIFHLYLISNNKTTYENFRYRYENEENPFNKGIIRNFKEVLCSGIPPSRVDFRAVVQLQSREAPSDLEIGSWTAAPPRNQVEDIHEQNKDSEPGGLMRMPYLFKEKLDAGK